MTNDEWEREARARVKGERFDLKERTKAFALRVIKVHGALPKSVLGDVMGKQVLRSGTSVGANYREADRARSKAEFVAKMGDALREIEETTYWLELLSDSDTVSPDRLAPLSAECNELAAIFSTIIRNAKR